MIRFRTTKLVEGSRTKDKIFHGPSFLSRSYEHTSFQMLKYHNIIQSKEKNHNLNWFLMIFLLFWWLFWLIWVHSVRGQFSNKVQLSIGSFVREDQAVTFEKHKLFENITTVLPTTCMAKLGPTTTEYLIGNIGNELLATDQDTFLNLALSPSSIPMPSRFKYLFGYKKDWTSGSTDQHVQFFTSYRMD